MRNSKVERKTKETDILVEINLDGSGKAEIQTGIGFFDHMLTQIAVHGLFDLELKAKGDLEIDSHHTVEDCALALGSAFQQALGEKKGIVRTASSVVPMDEALSQVVIDFSGRPYAVIQSCWSSPMVGGMPTTLIEHFFESFAAASAASLHCQVYYGLNNHHMAESLFKSFGRALAEASRVDPRRQGNIPSSKGAL